MESDEEVIRRAFEAYDDELTDLVPEFVTPEEHVESDEAEAWGVQVFQFGFALGAVTGDLVGESDDESENCDENEVGYVEGESDDEDESEPAEGETEVGFTEDRVEELIETTVGIIGERNLYSKDHFRH